MRELNPNEAALLILIVAESERLGRGLSRRVPVRLDRAGARRTARALAEECLVELTTEGVRPTLRGLYWELSRREEAPGMAEAVYRRVQEEKRATTTRPCSYDCGENGL